MHKLLLCMLPGETDNVTVQRLDVGLHLSSIKTSTGFADDVLRIFTSLPPKRSSTNLISLLQNWQPVLLSFVKAYPAQEQSLKHKVLQSNSLSLSLLSILYESSDIYPVLLSNRVYWFRHSGNIFAHPGAESYKQPPSNAGDAPLLIAPVESITYLQKVSLLFVVQASPLRVKDPVAGTSSLTHEVKDHVWPVLKFIPSFIPGKSVSLSTKFPESSKVAHAVVLPLASVELISIGSPFLCLIFNFPNSSIIRAPEEPSTGVSRLPTQTGLKNANLKLPLAEIRYSQSRIFCPCWTVSPNEYEQEAPIRREDTKTITMILLPLVPIDERCTARTWICISLVELSCVVAIELDAFTSQIRVAGPITSDLQELL
ncbi:hypothetical protein RJ641_024170 [Dillenia turbinata]|uniref:Uncharacterized protein n=1 Tax=Dillenia turbinata TaxID=194707 RepID=A0AAN8YTG4_9MAGN